MTACPPETRERIVRYYEKTVLDYKIVLRLGRHLGIHFGYHDAAGMSCPESILNMNRMLAYRAGIRPGTEILDAGCGIGGSAIWLARNLGARVTGITLLETQCASAQELAQRHGVPHLTRFLVRDYHATGFPTGSFDVVWGLESTCYAPDKRRLLGEMWRLLRPGGTVIIADGFEIDEAYSDDQRKLMERWLNGWAVDKLESVGRFSAALREVGFRDVEATDITGNVFPFSRWLRQRSRALLPLARLAHGLGLADPSQVENAVAGIWQYEALRRGLWRYVVFKARR